MQTQQELKDRMPEYISRMTKVRQPTPTPGQVWLTLDRREPRMVKVEAVNRDKGRQVQILHQDTQRHTNASIERFNGKLGGYGFLPDFQPQPAPTADDRTDALKFTLPAKPAPLFELEEKDSVPASTSAAQIRALFARINALENSERKMRNTLRLLLSTLGGVNG